jgi:hypothetical protein
MVRGDLCRRDVVEDVDRDENDDPCYETTLEDAVENWMDSLGRKGEYYPECERLEVEILADGAVAGTVELDLVKRIDNFHLVCDAESADLQSVSVKFCDRFGRSRLRCVKEVERDSDFYDRGEFVYVKTFHIKHEFIHNFGMVDLASRTLRLNSISNSNNSNDNIAIITITIAL